MTTKHSMNNNARSHPREQHSKHITYAVSGAVVCGILGYCCYYYLQWRSNSSKGHFRISFLSESTAGAEHQDSTHSLQSEIRRDKEEQDRLQRDKKRDEEERSRKDKEEQERLERETRERLQQRLRKAEEERLRKEEEQRLKREEEERRRRMEEERLRKEEIKDHQWLFTKLLHLRVRDLDQDMSGDIDRDEWLRHFYYRLCCPKKIALNLFDAIDIDGGGDITHDELRKWKKKHSKPDMLVKYFPRGYLAECERERIRRLQANHQASVKNARKSRRNWRSNSVNSSSEL